MKMCDKVKTLKACYCCGSEARLVTLGDKAFCPMCLQYQPKPAEPVRVSDECGGCGCAVLDDNDSGDIMTDLGGGNPHRLCVNCQ